MHLSDSSITPLEQPKPHQTLVLRNMLIEAHGKRKSPLQKWLHGDFQHDEPMSRLVKASRTHCSICHLRVGPWKFKAPHFDYHVRFNGPAPNCHHKKYVFTLIVSRLDPQASVDDTQLWALCWRSAKAWWCWSSLSLSVLVAQNTPCHPTIVLSSKRLTSHQTQFISQLAALQDFPHT